MAPPDIVFDPSARLAAIVESSDDAILSKTLDGVITSWNAAAQRLFGYTTEEAVGMPITQLIPPELQYEEADILARIRQGDRIQHYQTVRLSKSGRRLNLSLSISPVRDANGVIVGASKIARDVSREISAGVERERLLESERAARSEAERLGHLKDEFLATLSHELRTPLNAILGWCALLKEPSYRGVNQRQAIETIERNARSQAHIIDDLLDMSRIIAGKISLNIGPEHLSVAVQGAVEAIRPSATAKGLQLAVHLGNDDPVVSADPARLQQILWNLLTNAVKFTPPGGVVEVTLKRSGAHAEVRIQDSGMGIEPSFLPNVFDRFRQADAGTSRQFGGLGLGLSIVRTLVELHGGSAEVFSAGRDTGSTFMVRLPLRTHALQGHEALDLDERPISAFDAMPRLDGKVILVVDDDSDGRTLLARVLEERGSTVMQVSNGADALAILVAGRVDAVLSDIGMPGMDGYQFIEGVRALNDRGAASVPAIAVSAYARPEDRERAVAAGYHLHVAKPYSISGLVEAVNSLVN